MNQNNNENAIFNNQYFDNYKASQFKDTNFRENYNPDINDPKNDKIINLQNSLTTKAFQKNTSVEKSPNSKENILVKLNSPSRIETQINFFEKNADCNINYGFSSKCNDNDFNDENFYLKNELNYQNKCDEMKKNLNYFDRKQMAKDISIQKDKNDIININKNQKESIYNDKDYISKQEDINNAYQIKKRYKI